MKSILISSLCAALLSPAMVFAADGTINFTGSVIAATCTYTAAGKSQSVALPAVSASALSGPANTTTAGDTAFNVELDSCNAPKSVAIRLEGGAFDIATGNLKNTATTGAAGGVMVQLFDRNTNTPFQVSGTTAAVQSSADGKAVIPLLAKYVATGTVSAGSVTSSVNFSIIYP